MCSICCWTASLFDAATELPRTAITIRILATVVQWIELSPPKGVIQVRFLSGALLELPTATLHISAENFCFAASNSGNNFSKMVGMSIRLVATDKLMAAIV